MASLTRLVALATLAVVCLSQATIPKYEFEIFESEIEDKCLSKLWSVPHQDTKMQLIGQTMESFISMVEKVEEIHGEWSIFDVSRALLKRFAFEEMIFEDVLSDRRGKQKGNFKNRWDVMVKLLGVDTDSKTFKEEDLSEEEKCSMFFMMGHLVNDTFRDGVDEPVAFSDVPLDEPKPDLPHLPEVARSEPVKMVPKPREQGVVTVRGSENQAISLSKVLNALLASENNVEVGVNSLYGISLTTDLPINPLLGVTLGDVVSIAAISYDKVKAPTGARFFGPGGWWNTTACPTEFTLKEKPTESTNALLRGAVDGVLISRAVGNLKKDTSGLRLSRVLRMYYSPKGLPEGSIEGRGLSYCRREDVLNLYGTAEIQKSVLAYCSVLLNNALGFKPCDSDSMNHAVSQLTSAFKEMQDETGTEECKGQNGQVPDDQPVCETPTNVFVVLDTSESLSTGLTEQADIVRYLSSGLDFGRGVGSLNVYYDSKWQGFVGLKNITSNNTNPTCAACEAARVDRGDEGFSPKAVSEVVILDGLNKTLQEFERTYDLLPGVPNKVVVMFHYENVKEENEKRLTGSRNILRDGHRDTRMFVVSSTDKESLSVLADGTSNVVSDKRTPKDLANELIKKICRVPAVFQFNRCYDHNKGTRNEGQNVYTGYVTEGHVQFWAFYPEYFLKSYSIRIQFHAENGDITVCEKRGEDNPGYIEDSFNKDGCKTTDQNSKSVEFTFRNPCENYHVHNCPPINFAVVGVGKISESNCPVDDDKCRRFDQIRFRMEHDGVFCSGCDYVKASMWTIIVATVVFFLRRF